MTSRKQTAPPPWRSQQDTQYGHLVPGGHARAASPALYLPLAALLLIKALRLALAEAHVRGQSATPLGTLRPALAAETEGLS